MRIALIINNIKLFGIKFLLNIIVLIVLCMKKSYIISTDFIEIIKEKIM